MSRKSYKMEDIIPDLTKIRKRSCSPSSSSSSVLQNYRFKKAVLVRKRGEGSSSTPVPNWRKIIASRSPSVAFQVAAESPRYVPSKLRPPQQPVSARKLAATLWELNEVPSPAMSGDLSGRGKFRREEKRRDRGRRSSVHSGSLPPHLSDPSHSPVSQRMPQPGSRIDRRMEPSVGRRLKIPEQGVGALDSVTNANLMEFEIESRCETPASSRALGATTRLKDVSGALTTSKELLKIITRMWGQENHPSPSLSLVSAFHTELERARLQVNQLIQEQGSDHNEINYLMRHFTEEKAAWRNKEQQVVKSAVESISGELEVERKLRRRLESLNKKLGSELAETKASLLKVLKELESERKTREAVEQFCDELSRDMGGNEVEEMKGESVRVHEDVGKEREMFHMANELGEEKSQMKLPGAKHQFEEKNTSVDKLWNELEAAFRYGRGNKGKRHDGRRDIDLAASLNIGFVQDEPREEDSALVEDNDIDVDSGEDSAESDLHPLELYLNERSRRSHTTDYVSSKYQKKLSTNGLNGRNSAYTEEPRKSNYLQRCSSDMIDWEGLDGKRYQQQLEQEKPARRSCQDEMERYKLLKSLRDRVPFRSRLGSDKRFAASPSQQFDQPWTSGDRSSVMLERPMNTENGSKMGKGRRSQS